MAATPRTKAREAAGILAHMEEVYDAAMADASDKLDQMQNDFTDRAKARREALDARRKAMNADE